MITVTIMSNRWREPILVEKYFPIRVRIRMVRIKQYVKWYYRLEVTS